MILQFFKSLFWLQFCIYFSCILYTFLFLTNHVKYGHIFSSQNTNLCKCPFLSTFLMCLKGQFTHSACLSCLKQLFMLVKIVQLSPLTDERMRRNEEKREEKIRPPDAITKAALKWSQGRPRNEVRAAPKWSQGRPKMESGPP